MLEQPVRLGGLALLCALATSVLVLVTFLASTLLLSVIGGIGAVVAEPTDDRPAGAVLLSARPSEQRKTEKPCVRHGRDAEQGSRAGLRCAERRGSEAAVRP